MTIVGHLVAENVSCMSSTVPNPLVVPALAGKTGDLSNTGQAEFPPKGGTTNKAGQSNSPETSDRHLECGDLSPLCLSKTAFLSISVGKQK